MKFTFSFGQIIKSSDDGSSFDIEEWNLSDG